MKLPIKPAEDGTYHPEENSRKMNIDGKWSQDADQSSNWTYARTRPYTGACNVWEQNRSERSFGESLFDKEAKGKLVRLMSLAHG